MQGPNFGDTQMVLKRASATSLKCTSALWPAYLVDKNTGRTWQAVGTCLRLCYIPVWKGGSQTVQDRHNIIMCNMHTLHTHTHPHPQTPTHTYIHIYINIYMQTFVCSSHTCMFIRPAGQVDLPSGSSPLRTSNPRLNTLFRCNNQHVFW